MRDLHSAEDGHYAPLPIIDGPWNADVWNIERPLRFETGGDRECFVESCTAPAGKALGERPRPEDVLCVAHRRRRAELPKLVSVTDFIEMQKSASPIRQPRGAKNRLEFFHPIDFRLIHHRLAEELRYVTSIKVNRNNWRDPRYANDVLRTAIAIGVRYQAVHHEDIAGHLAAGIKVSGKPGATDHISSYGLRSLGMALPTMVQIAADATEDPWESLKWHAADLRLSGDAKETIAWTSVTCGWLREGLRQLGRRDALSGARAWNTIRGHVRAGSVISAFMDEQTGHLSPNEITHDVILELVAWLRDRDSVRQDFHAVNILVTQLYRMRADGIQPEIVDTVFLRRGDNPIRKSRKPKPFPEDLLHQIDSLVHADDVWPADLQLMMRLFRATGPRASEALSLPLDCVSYVEGRGYTLEYFMSKVDDWRRIPLPPKLGEDLVRHRELIQRDHPDSPYLFPYFGQSPRTNSLTYERTLYSPWPYGRFTAQVWSIYQQHGIVSSSQTGERLTGAQLHRFRHSIATGLLNEGWSQYEVQKFLGHKSHTMVQAYAELHDDKLRDKYTDFVNKSVGIDGMPSQALTADEVEVERLREVMVRATLPNGYCTLPEKQTCNYLPSPCLSCVFFKTTPTFLPIHIRQRDDSLREIDLAKSDGRERAVEAHEQTVIRLNTIIDGLHKTIADESEDVA